MMEPQQLIHKRATYTKKKQDYCLSWRTCGSRRGCLFCKSWLLLLFHSRHRAKSIYQCRVVYIHVAQWENNQIREKRIARRKKKPQHKTRSRPRSLEVCVWCFFFSFYVIDLLLWNSIFMSVLAFDKSESRKCAIHKSVNHDFFLYVHTSLYWPLPPCMASDTIIAWCTVQLMHIPQHPSTSDHHQTQMKSQMILASRPRFQQ